MHDAPAEPPPDGGRPHRWRRLMTLVAALVVLAALYVTLALALPGTIPRLALLPKPTDRTWSDGCNEHIETWDRHGIFWRPSRFSTLALCVEGP